MRDINHHIKPFLPLIALLILLAILLGLFSCNIEKQTTRKDNAAVNRVNANAELQTPVVNRWLLTHPQDTVTQIVTLPPTVIKVPVVQLEPDTVAIRKVKDSLLALGKECGEEAMDAFDLGYDEAEKYYKAHPITVVCPPNTKEIVTNNSTINRLRDSCHQKDKEISYLRGKNDSALESLGDAKKTNTKLWWLIVGLSVVSVLSHVARSYVPSLISKLPKIPKLW